MAANTGRLRLVSADSLTADTAQTQGMRRVAAISTDTVGSRRIFMGQTVVAPETSSGPHHHGESETAIFVVSGNPVFSYREGNQEVRLETRPRDYVYVPPHVPHIESNPSPDVEAVIVVARSTQEAIVENLHAL